MANIVNFTLSKLNEAWEGLTSDESSSNLGLITAVALGAIGAYVWVRRGYYEETEYRYINGGFPRLMPPLSDFTSNARLREVSINSMEPVALDFSNKTRLRNLFVTNTQFTVTPDFFSCVNLEVVALITCQLTTAPNFSNCKNLISVDLYGNRLTTCPDFTPNARLRWIGLTRNRLNELHDSILRLPRTSFVDCTHNRFSPEYMEQFQARLEQHRLSFPAQGPTVSFSVADDSSSDDELLLDEQIGSWIKEYKKTFSENISDFPMVTFSSLDAETQELFSKYLRRLRDVQDYTAGGPSQKNIILRVHKMLDLAHRNAEFLPAMLGLIAEGVETCGDRVQITFNDIEVLSQFHERALPQEEFRKLCLRAARYEAVKKWAEKICRDKQLGDPIETILHFHLALKHSLDLPISTEGMLYSRLSGVTEDMIQRAEKAIGSLSEEQLLSQSGYWQAYIQKGHKDSADQITKYYTDLLADLEEYFQEHANSKAEQGTYLEEHPALESFLTKAKAQHIAFEYTALARFLGQERERAISRLI
jgi:hypothetical protein